MVVFLLSLRDVKVLEILLVNVLNCLLIGCFVGVELVIEIVVVVWFLLVLFFDDMVVLRLVRWNCVLDFEMGVCLGLLVGIG